MPLLPLLRAYRDYAARYMSIDDMVDDMRADYWLPLMPRVRLVKFARMARNRAARMES
jgi:hypothetical protein